MPSAPTWTVGRLVTISRHLEGNASLQEKITWTAELTCTLLQILENYSDPGGRTSLMLQATTLTSRLRSFHLQRVTHTRAKMATSLLEGLPNHQIIYLQEGLNTIQSSMQLVETSFFDFVKSMLQDCFLAASAPYANMPNGAFPSGSRTVSTRQFLDFDLGDFPELLAWPSENIGLDRGGKCLARPMVISGGPRSPLPAMSPLSRALIS